MGENNFAIQTEPSDTPVVAKAVRGFQRIAAADIEQTVQNLSLDEKVALLTGKFSLRINHLAFEAASLSFHCR